RGGLCAFFFSSDHPARLLHVGRWVVARSDAQRPLQTIRRSVEGGQARVLRGFGAKPGSNVGDRTHGTSDNRQGWHRHRQSALDRDLEYAAQAFFRRDYALNDEAGWVQSPPFVKNSSRVMCV